MRITEVQDSVTTNFERSRAASDEAAKEAIESKAIRDAVAPLHERALAIRAAMADIVLARPSRIGEGISGLITLPGVERPDGSITGTRAIVEGNVANYLNHGKRGEPYFDPFTSVVGRGVGGFGTGRELVRPIVVGGYNTTRYDVVGPDRDQVREIYGSEAQISSAGTDEEGKRLYGVRIGFEPGIDMQMLETRVKNYTNSEEDVTKWQEHYGPQLVAREETVDMLNQAVGIVSPGYQ